MLLTARYVLPVTGPHIEDGAVLVRGSEIVEVGPMADLMTRYPDEEHKDFGPAVIMPGFVDLHTHLEYTAFRGAVDDLPYSQWKLELVEKESALTEADWEESARLGALEALQSGITTIADITDSGASARAAAAAGLRGIVYREVSTMEKSAVVDVMERAAADIEAWSSLSDLLRIGIAPHAPYTCHPELFRSVSRFANERAVPVAIHLAGSKDEYDFIKYGSSPFAVDFEEDAHTWSDAGWLPTGVSPVRYVLQWGLFDVPELLAVHCVQVDGSDIDVLASHDVSIAYCARCNAKLGMGVAPLSAFFEHGIPVGIGTDSPASNSTIDFFDEMRIGLLLQRALLGDESWFTADSFVRMATIDGAKALRMDDRVGSLEPGKQADIIAVDLSMTHQVPTRNPNSALVHRSNQENVLLTMVAGRVLYERGDFRTVDSEAVFDSVERMRSRLRA